MNKSKYIWYIYTDQGHISDLLSLHHLIKTFAGLAYKIHD